MVYAPLESSDISNYWEFINVLARICSIISKVYKVSKLEGQISCKFNLNALTYLKLNLHIYYPSLLKKSRIK